MGKIFLTLMAALLSTTVWAGTLFTQGNFIYETQSEPTASDYGTCSVYGLSDEGKEASGFFLPSTAWTNGKGYYVRSINASAFKNQKNIVEFIVGHQLTTINAYAFQGCSNLESIYLPSSMWRIYGYAFDGCTELTHVYMASPTPMTGGWYSTTFPANSNMWLYIGPGDPNGIYKYKNSTDCTRFSGVYKSAYACDTWYNDGTRVRVTKAATKTTVGEYAMIGFRSTAINVTNGAWVPKAASASYDYSSNNLHYNLTSIIDSACVNNTDITRVDMSYLPHVNSIGAYAFKGCTNITYAYPNATTVGVHAFAGCTALKTVYLRDETATVKEWAFRACSSLTTINLGMVTNWNPLAIAYCTGISAYTINSANTAYVVSNGILFNKAQTTLVSYPPAKTDYSINYVPNTVTAFGDFSFISNTKITQLLVPYGVKSIGFDAFWNMTALTYVHIPGSVTSIGNYAFEGCTALNQIDCNMTTPETISNHFYNAKATIPTLCVPYGKVDAYKNAGWTRFTNYNPNYSQAFDYYDGDLTYTILKNTSVTINGNTYGGTARVVPSTTAPKPSGAKAIPGWFSYRGKAYAVTSIGYDAFRGITNSFSLTGATNVDTVYNDAFNGSNLTSITLPACQLLHYRAFKSATKLTSVNFPKVKVLYNWCFQGCTGLTSASLPSIVTVYDYAFDGCTNLSKMTFGPNLWAIHAYAYQNCSALTQDIILPYGFAGLYSCAFSGSGVKRLKVPSTLANFEDDSFANMNSLTELYINKPLALLPPPYTFGTTPTSAILRVPAGQENLFKADSYWGRFTTITAGGYDFSLSSGINSEYHMSVLTTTSVTKDGTTCDGTAKYVYNPFLSNSTVTAYSADTYETNQEYPVLSGTTQKKYFITEIGDSAYANTRITSYFVPKYVTRIGKHAFYGNRALTTFKVPSSVTYIGRDAFTGIPTLTELFLYQPSDTRNWDGRFFGGNASNFICYVKSDVHYDYWNSAKKWAIVSPSTVRPENQINGYFQETGESVSFSINHPVDFATSGLEAYVVSNYDQAKKQANLQQVSQVSEATGVILTGFNNDQIYKLKRPTATASAPDNLLIGNPSATADVYNESVGYSWDSNSKFFWRPSSSYSLSRGHAYLKLSSALAGNTNTIYTNLWPQMLIGDVNGDGEVSVADITALANLLLDDTSNERSDVNGDGETSIADMTSLVGILMKEDL